MFKEIKQYLRYQKIQVLLKVELSEYNENEVEISE